MKKKRTDSIFVVDTLESRQLLAATTYLSDLPTAVTPINGWGPIEKDRSNGESGANDGHVITLGGVTYAKGLGVHANSEVAYDLVASAGYTSFQADVGVDDEVGNNGSVAFTVYLNDQPLSSTNVLTGSSPTQSINVNVAGKTGRLRLVVSNGNNGNTFDHADWANARLVSGELPVITGQVQGNLASESSSDVSSGIFKITRTGSTTDPLDVFFNAGGTATLGTDYQLLANGVVLNSNSITIPQGNATAELQIRAIDDSVYDPNEQVLITLNGRPAYTLGSPNSGDFTIVDNDPAPAGTFLSDLNPTSSQNGWGPYEKDHSNGESGAGDGHSLTLAGQTFVKGLGVHANSNLTYNIGGQGFTRFQSSVGLDDEVGSNGSVIFQVFVDGQKKFDSGVMTGSSATKLVDVDLTGAGTLQLVVTDSGNGNTFDHGDWADAKLIKNAPSGADYSLGVVDRSALSPTEGGSERFIVELNPVKGNPGPLSFDYETFDLTATAGKDYVPVSGHIDVPAGSGFSTYNVYVQTLTDNVIDPGERIGFRIKNVVGSANVFSDTGSIGIFNVAVPLSQLTPVSQTNGWGPIEKNKSNGESGANDGHAISLNGMNNYGYGLGVHANSEIIYDISSTNAKTFHSDIGVDDEVGNNGSVVFQVYVDNQIKYDSGLMTGSSANKTIDVDVTGASTLRLVVNDGGDGNTFDHADWGGASLI